jgi:hypothetical protein
MHVIAAVESWTAVESGLGLRNAATHTAMDTARSDHAAVESAND